jgi:hypothetical protein
VRHEQRPPDAVEVAAYYVASEALTNVAKHSDARLRLSICDDGGGGADPEQGIRPRRPQGSCRGARRDDQGRKSTRKRNATPSRDPSAFGFVGRPSRSSISSRP